MYYPKKSFRMLVLLLSSILLAGCVLNTADAYYGSGPLKLSPAVRAIYNKYLTEAAPHAFAVSTDGQRASYFYCADYICLADNSARKAVDRCEEMYDRPCKLYADGTKVVWRFNSPASSSTK